MLHITYLHDDNRLHTHGTLGDLVGHEFDYDDPECAELFSPTDNAWMDEASLRFLRDFILNCSLYVSDLEAALGQEQSDFWEDREHAYRVISQLLVDLYRLEDD